MKFLIKGRHIPSFLKTDTCVYEEQEHYEVEYNKDNPSKLIVAGKKYNLLDQHLTGLSDEQVYNKQLEILKYTLLYGVYWIQCYTVIENLINKEGYVDDEFFIYDSANKRDYKIIEVNGYKKLIFDGSSIIEEDC